MSLAEKRRSVIKKPSIEKRVKQIHGIREVSGWWRGVKPRKKGREGKGINCIRLGIEK